MSQDFRYLCMAAAAIDARHQFAEPLRLGDPWRGAAFRKAAIIHKLDIEAATTGRPFAEHIGLQHAGLIPRRLPAHGRVERKNQTATRARLDRGAERTDAVEEGIDFGARGARRSPLGRPGFGRCRARRRCVAGPIFAHG